MEKTEQTHRGKGQMEGWGENGRSESRKMWVKMVRSMQTSQEQGQSLLHDIEGTEHQQRLRLV